jgi:serine protease DegQ
MDRNVAGSESDGRRMKRTSLYSSSNRSLKKRGPFPGASPGGPAAADVPRAKTSTVAVSLWRFFPARKWLRRFDRPLLVAAGVLFAFALVFVYARMTPAPHALTQDDIDKAVLHTLESKDLPSAAARAYEIVRPSVVRVRRLSDSPTEAGSAKAREDGEVKGKASEKGKTKEDKDFKEFVTGIGTGVVIVDSGLILTSLHVVAGAERIGVVFFDGLESDALLVSAQPENDLAVLQATKLPDDLVPATLKSTQDLRVGDQVIAVGFPFGIGPSASVGAVSGLRRSFFSPEGKRELSNLIQFDAAANPGNSGGPLITADGGVVGIVAAILNPVGQRFFVGLGFAVPIENAAAAVGMSPF